MHQNELKNEIMILQDIVWYGLRNGLIFSPSQWYHRRIHHTPLHKQIHIKTFWDSAPIYCNGHEAIVHKTLIGRRTIVQ